MTEPTERSHNQQPQTQTNLTRRSQRRRRQPIRWADEGPTRSTEGNDGCALSSRTSSSEAHHTRALASTSPAPGRETPASSNPLRQVVDPSAPTHPFSGPVSAGRPAKHQCRSHDHSNGSPSHLHSLPNSPAPGQNQTTSPQL